MGSNTENYNLIKPSPEDYNIFKDQNINMDIIDSQLKKLETSYTASDVLTKLKTVDGSGSGIDADLLDGKEATAFATAAQGTKADNATTQTSFNAHLADITKHKQASGITQTGPYANAEGYRTKASGYYSHAEGSDTTANGFYSHAEGYYTTASEGGSHSEGCWTTATGFSSHAEGGMTTTTGFYSHAEGSGTIANVHSSHAGGRYNKPLTGSINGSDGSEDLFVIGNGIDESSRGNAFRVTCDGNTYGLSSFNSTGADYAEYFEWADGNIVGEDRVGYFVTLDGDKIRKATSTDDFILGVISVNPSVIGDSYADDWSGKYITDEWGRIQYHNVVVPATYRTGKNGEQIEVIKERTDYVPVLNPVWDSSKKYISRKLRKEWSPVGMVGKLLVRDDGTSQVNGYCRPNDNGIATTAVEGFIVMKRVSKNIIQLVK